jgi:hypothetical protein
MEIKTIIYYSILTIVIAYLFAVPLILNFLGSMLSSKKMLSKYSKSGEHEKTEQDKILNSWDKHYANELKKRDQELKGIYRLSGQVQVIEKSGIFEDLWYEFIKMEAIFYPTQIINSTIIGAFDMNLLTGPIQNHELSEFLCLL